jgi:hypothetical protein
MNGPEPISGVWFRLGPEARDSDRAREVPRFEKGISPLASSVEMT